MKRKLLLLIGFSLWHFTLLQAQNRSCRHKGLCLDAIDPTLNDEKRRLLKDNWTDYVGVDLESSFPLDPAGRLNVLSIRLDAFGCLYPDLENPEQLRNTFINDETLGNLYFQKLSFYNLFERDSGNSINLPANSNASNDIRALFVKGRKRVPADFFVFRERWNSIFLERKVQELDSIIQKKGIKRIYFFFNGFNVPYALSQLQGNSIFRDIMVNKPSSIDASEILFVRVFWPSFSKKRSNFMGTNCKITNKQLTVAFSKLFKYISNRGYLCGLTINEIIHRLPQKVQYNLISHSFGSTITTAVILDPKSKMSGEESDINDSLKALFRRRESLSDRQLNFFMSAPGMPGLNSFKSIDSITNRKHFFYIGHNRRDKIQLKQVLVPFIRFPRSFSSTALGCNFKGEADRLYTSVSNRGMGGNFFVTRTSYDPEHDIYCYRRQELFQKFFKKFVEDTMSKNP